MRLGVSTFAYPWAIGIPSHMPDNPMDAFNFIQSVSDLGVNLVQIADNLLLHKYSYEERDKLCLYARNLGVDIEVGTRGLLTENIRSYIKIAQQLQSPLLRVVIDTREFKPGINEIKKILAELIPELEEADIILAIENHDRFKTIELKDIIESLNNNPYIGICLDTVNSFGSLEGPEVVVDNLGPYTVNLHLKDFTMQRDDNQLGFAIRGTPAGQGMLDIKWLLQRLIEFNGHNLSGILELWMPPEDSVEETLKKEREWVSTSIEYLRKYYY